MCKHSDLKMASPEETERSVAKKLRHLGRKLLKGSSLHKLLQLLHKLELVLSTLDQEPTKLIQESLVPCMKALISDELLRHADEDVKILVISCISEIARITAPDAPYDDEQMKEIFKLTVASFEKLSHISGCAYEKVLIILENVNKVRLCLVMLDLECNDLVIEMFQHFLRFIRSNHPCSAFHSMESIMTMILQESEQISPDLLRPLLDSVGNENRTVSPMSGTLGEKVIRNCTAKLKPYLMKAVESSGRAINEYAQIVTDICQNESESPQCDDSNGSKKTVVQEAENKLNVPNDAKEQPHDETKGHEPNVTGKRDVQILDDTKSNRRSILDGEVTKKTGSKRRSCSEISKNSKKGSAKTKLETENLESVQEPKSETQLNTVPRKRGRKPNSLMNAEEGYDHSWICRETEVGRSTLSRKSCDSRFPFRSSEKATSRKDKLHRKHKTVSETLVHKPKSEDIAKTTKLRRTHNISNDFPPNDTSEGREASASKPKADDNADASPSTNNNISDGCHSKRGRRRKLNITGNQGVHSNSLSMLKDNSNPPPQKISLDSPTVRLEKESEARNISEQKPIRKIKFSLRLDGKLVMGPESAANGEPNDSCGEEGKHKSSMNDEPASIKEGTFSTQTNVKKRRRLDATPNEGLNKLSAVKDLTAESASKTLNSVKETPQARLRRRHSDVSAKASECLYKDKSLVGKRIKVWWPKDKTFYEGVIESYDPIKGKHKILYADGDVEVLNLKKQKWTVVDVSLDKEGLTLQRLAEASDVAEKDKEKSELVSAKATTIKSQSRNDSKKPKNQKRNS
ncbi:Protein EMSY-LIKE 4 [Vigna angularis]|uniref:Protein EMSY-LIKE 4 n=1 Tax=Phaseolus angularis TaxID=3914 RepID=A0A8T0JN69_PHAAN|nr:sister chromatid cohesion protein PDS5 homolog D isoform X2 [Vigna angularis]KAG2379715.1 Protein EMSY-LIKE 4 [Vigna angularis]